MKLPTRTVELRLSKPDISILNMNMGSFCVRYFFGDKFFKADKFLNHLIGEAKVADTPISDIRKKLPISALMTAKLGVGTATIVKILNKLAHFGIEWE